MISFATPRFTVIMALLILAGCGGGGSAKTDASASTGSSLSAASSTSSALVPSANRSPQPIASTKSKRAVIGQPFSYDLLQDGQLFFDPDGDPLTYTVTWNMWSSVDGSSLWDGLRISGTLIQGTSRQNWSNEIVVLALDGRGGSATLRIPVTSIANSVPSIRLANSDRVVTLNTTLDIDVTNQGTTFIDTDGDPLTYTVTLSPIARGLSVVGTRVVGRIDSLGAVRVSVTASDPYGGKVVDTFNIAVPSPQPGQPQLPTISYQYQDELLDWPELYRLSREIKIPFWDTTPVDNPTSNMGATLGRVLFYDKRLSITNTHSCSSCHKQSLGFAAPTRFSMGATGELTHRNAMALGDVRYNTLNTYFSDLRVEGLEKLALMPIEDPIELGNSIPLLIEKLSTTNFYPQLFFNAFGTAEITGDRIARALAQFLRSMVSYRSKFDRAYLAESPRSEANPASVFSSQELLGAEMFVRGNCGHCHVNDIQAFSGRAANNGLDVSPVDPGAGQGAFRPASLRNIAVSGPYMHDGRFSTLREVIDHYDSGVKNSPDLDFLLQDHQSQTPIPLRLNMTEEQKLALEAFLNTFTDEDFLHDPKFSDPFP